jgi:hypothetical protein
MPDSLERVQTLMAGSELLRDAAAVRRDGGIALALGTTPLRPLAAAEITRLEALGNSAADWGRVRAADGFDPATVRQSRFQGDVILGRFTRPVPIADSLTLPSGIYQSTLADCVIGHDALVQDVRLLAHYVVGPGALLLDCGLVACASRTAFGNGLVLPLGIETGGREVPAFAEIDVPTADHIARSRAQRELLAVYGKLVADYAARASCERGIIGAGAVVRNTPEVHQCYLGPGARVEGATSVRDCTLLSSVEEPARIASGASVRTSLIQWGCQVETMAIVEGSVLTEHSHAERHAKVLGSLIGPNSGVAEGEVSASLLGPFVGFHHQALLIAALWPEGKGNVAYGANVGSNHTSRMPDQEFWPGEGAYLGLGVNVKYPSDYRQAPYTVVAMGVSTLPQKLAFPFSLVSEPWQPCPTVPPAYNEIVPAWVLRDNLYMLRRNEGKYRDRNRARRTHFDFRVFRPDTVELMRAAWRRLEVAPSGRDIYTEQEIEGLGKNFLRAENLRPAIEAYRFHTLLYSLLGLLERVKSEPDVSGILTTPSAEQSWEYQRRLLHDEWQLTDVAAALARLPPMLEQIARDVERSKAKDDRRGQRILEDYADTHTLAAEDVFVRQTWEETRRRIKEVERALGEL